MKWQKSILFLILFFFLTEFSGFAQIISTQTIFKSGTDGYSTFRIPAIVKTNSGRLLAFAEGRVNSRSDAGDIDLVMKSSDDNGKTWVSLKIIWNDKKNTCGNPAPVVDRKSGKIILVMTWKLGGTTLQHQVNECTVAELPNGKLLLNMRNYDRTQKTRKISWSENRGETWSDIQAAEDLIEPICQASLLFVNTNKTLYFSNPSNENKRVNMTVKSSNDFGQTWEIVQTLHKGPAAYSDLTPIAKNTIGCLFEKGEENPYEEIVFTTIKIN